MAFKTDTPNVHLFNGAAREVKRGVDQLAERIYDALVEFKKAEKIVNQAKESLRELVKARYWKVNFGMAKPTHTFDVGPADASVQINFNNAYPVEADQAKTRFIEVLKIIRGTGLERHLQERSIVNADVTNLNKQQMVEFFKEMSALCGKYGVQGFVDDKYVVAKEFHDERHELMPAVNEAVDKIMPVQVHITI